MEGIQDDMEWEDGQNSSMESEHVVGTVTTEKVTASNPTPPVKEKKKRQVSLCCTILEYLTSYSIIAKHVLNTYCRLVQNQQKHQNRRS